MRVGGRAHVLKLVCVCACVRVCVCASACVSRSVVRTNMPRCTYLLCYV